MEDHRKRQNQTNESERTMDRNMKMYPTPRASGQEDAETLIKRKGEKAASQHNLDGTHANVSNTIGVVRWM